MSRRNFGKVIARLGKDDFIVKRRADGEFIEGRYRRPTGADTEFPATGSVQVMTPRELQILPEGTRALAKRKLYTECELKTGSIETNGKEPDHVVFNGTEYEVQSVADWSQQAGYFKYLLMKAGQ